MLKEFVTKLIKTHGGIFKVSSRASKELNIFITNMTRALLQRVQEGSDIESPSDISIILMTMIKVHGFNQSIRDPKWSGKVKFIKKKTGMRFNLSSQITDEITKFILNTIEVIVFMLVNIANPYNKKTVKELNLWRVVAMLIPKKLMTFVSDGSTFKIKGGGRRTGAKPRGRGRSTKRRAPRRRNR